MESINDDTVIPATQESPDVIKPIGKETVHRICSGQVVLSLAIAMKELVENAIDASATNIEIKLIEYGSDLLEVSDNGSGIKRENFIGLTQKHATSKIRSFDDLEFVQTLGFRGEALSSLCALADLSVITRHSSADNASQISYDHNGTIIEEKPAARTVGTTISLKNLFKTLPVRRKEFTKNLKREFNKMCHLLNAYCLVSKGIKFTCTNQTNKGSKNKVVATQGLNSIKSNIMAVFSTDQASSLKEVELIEPDESLLEEFGVKRAIGDPVPFKIECFISSAVHGCGRSSSDRQFYFINSRPFESTKITKLVNGTYRKFNGNQYPFVFMNLLMETNLLDVNITPDKRQIYMQEEKLLLCAIKASLLNCFKESPSTIRMQNLDLSKQLMDTENSRGMKRSLSDFANNSQNTHKKLKNVSAESTCSKSVSLEHFNFTSVPKEEVEEITECKLTELNNCKVNIDKAIIDKDDILENEAKEMPIDKSHNDTSINKESERENHTINKVENSLENNSFTLKEKEKKGSPKKSKIDNVDESSSSGWEDSPIKSKKPFKFEEFKSKPCSSKNNTNNDVSYTIAEDTFHKEKKIIPFNISMSSVEKAVEKKMKDRMEIEEKMSKMSIKFRSEITPEGNKTAEQELQKQITKDMFKKMEIIGQFNKGFIIAKLENDLFIIDQHASDEKYNFEQLQSTTVMENQKLVVPKPLNLTAANEELLIDNLEIFKKNGFSFKINEDAESTKKVSLKSIPMSKNYIFGKDDIDEMLFMLQDGDNNTMVRPSRIRGMFASRACRKSVMVGKPLSESEMRRILDHMSEIDQPWNCPHGRPTMRHLINLQLIKD